MKVLLKRAEFDGFAADNISRLVSIYGNVPGIVPEDGPENALVYVKHFNSLFMIVMR